MFAQQNQLKRLFPEHGWELIEARETGEWWRPEEWIIKSLWSPKECRIRVSFISDFQLEDKTKAKLNIWSIRFELEEVSDRIENSYFEFWYVKNGWEKNRDEIFKNLADLRNQFAKINS